MHTHPTVVVGESDSAAEAPLCTKERTTRIAGRAVRRSPVCRTHEGCCDTVRGRVVWLERVGGSRPSRARRAR
jgi:hypothetical protein